MLVIYYGVSSSSKAAIRGAMAADDLQRQIAGRKEQLKAA